MEIKKILLIVVCLIIFQIQISDSQPTASIAFTYDFNKTTETNTLLHYTSSVLLVMNTPIETTCYYTIVANTTPSNSFDTNYGTRHEKEIENVSPGLHKYYIQCGGTSNPIMQVSFQTKETVFATIILSEDDPLTANTYEIDLTTSSNIIGKPELEYSFDGIVYRPIPLTGSEKSWRGYLIIDETVGETVCSFKFKATDLDGKEGNTIKGQSIFEIDTVPPKIVTNIDATGYKNEIEIEWIEEEQVKTYRIYRSENPGVSYSNYYTKTEETEYRDTSVTAGKTYYYKIAGIDEADNIGALSREVEATALLSESTTTSTGLAPKLIGRVDNVITEIELFKEDIELLERSIGTKTQEEQILFSDLQLEKEYTKAIAELDATKKEVERFKQQDLTENELDSKIKSAQLKIEILKKRIPESITVISQNTLKKDLSKENLETLILEYAQTDLTESEIRKTLEQTIETIETTQTSIDSSLTNVEITYIDGTKDEKCVIKDTIKKDTSDEEIDQKIVLYVPKEVANSVSDMIFNTNDYEIIKEDPVLAFNEDTQEIVYILEEHVSTAKLEDIIVSPITLYTQTEKQSILTGFSILNSESVSYQTIGSIILGIVLLCLLFYFIVMKRRQKNKPLAKIKELIKEATYFKKEHEKEALKKVYNEIKEVYKELDQEDKKRVYEKINKLHRK